MTQPSEENPCYECGEPGRPYTLNFVDCCLCDACAEENGIPVEEYHPNDVRCDKTQDLFS